MSNTYTFVGVIKTYHDKEETHIKEEYFVNAGKKEGIYKTYYKNGKLKEEINHINGLRHGKYHYYKYGKLYKKAKYPLSA